MGLCAEPLGHKMEPLMSQVLDGACWPLQTQPQPGRTVRWAWVVYIEIQTSRPTAVLHPIWASPFTILQQCKLLHM